jgi:hypothetical protein
VRKGILRVLVCLAQCKPSDCLGGGRSDDGIEMEQNGN